MKKTEFRIKYSQTTRNKLKCQRCCSWVGGVTGFFWVKWKDYYDYSKCPICLDCWNKIIKEIETKMETRVKDYKLLLKRQMLRRLK